MIEIFGPLASMVVMIVIIATIGDILKQRYRYRGENKEALTQIQADLNELKKRVAEIQEYITDMYIQQHDQRLK